MKSVLIVFNQSFTDSVEYLLERLQIRGYTFLENVKGRGSVSGDPRKGTHTWPEMNSAMIVMIEDERVDDLLIAVKKLDNTNKEVGIRAFVWTIERTV